MTNFTLIHFSTIVYEDTQKSIDNHTTNQISTKKREIFPDGTTKTANHKMTKQRNS